ncbi:hypothetical protein CLOP_g2098 [Closterium sp. NIES-67]|nr:hypothetical protein CLOP_g2098 [Closterium sp. NIES-67]
MCRLLGKARLWRWRGMDMREAASRWEQQVGRGVQAQAWRPRGPWAAHEARTSGVPNQSEPPGCDLAAMCVAHSLPRAGGCGAAWLAGAHRAGRLPRVPQMRHHLPARLESLSAARVPAPHAQLFVHSPDAMPLTRPPPRRCACCSSWRRTPRWRPPRGRGAWTWPWGTRRAARCS